MLHQLFKVVCQRLSLCLRKRKNMLLQFQRYKLTKFQWLGMLQSKVQIWQQNVSFLHLKRSKPTDQLSPQLHPQSAHQTHQSRRVHKSKTRLKTAKTYPKSNHLSVLLLRKIRRKLRSGTVLKYQKLGIQASLKSVKKQLWLSRAICLTALINKSWVLKVQTLT